MLLLCGATVLQRGRADKEKVVGLGKVQPQLILNYNYNNIVLYQCQDIFQKNISSFSQNRF